MNQPLDIRKARRHLQAEREAALLYRRMAAAEPQAELKSVYGKLAETEERHVAHWEEQLRAAGVTDLATGVNWRTHVLMWLARRFGNALIVPTIAAVEQSAGAEYAGGVAPAKMVADERSHALIFKELAGQGGGMEGSAVAKLEGRHRSAGGNALRAGVLGANDGLVSNFSLIMGVAGASAGSHGAVLVTGLAGMLAGAISMALGEWLSVQSARELFTKQIKIEEEELLTAPEEEMEELSLIYQAKGLPPEEAQRLARRLVDDPARALDTLAREELGIDPDELGGSAWEAAGTSFLLFSAGAIIPVAPFIFTGGATGIYWSASLSALGLFGIGAAITLVTGQNAFKSGLRMVLTGLAAAAVTYGLGRLVGGHLG